ncbi:unnamed protein product, partial [Coregonus sp. 'balchen']
MDTNLLPELCVYTWGANSYGQLGLGNVEDLSVAKLALNTLQTGAVRLLSGGDRGQVLTCGSNAYGQLGVSEHVTHSAQLLTIKMLMEPVISTGGVYQWGMGLSGQAKRALSPQPVPAHFTSRIPCLVPGLDQVMSHRVAAGSAHCVCLTAEGGVFMWGSNKHRQLTGTELFLPRPVLLDRSLLGGEKVKRIRSGWTHLVAQTGQNQPIRVQISDQVVRRRELPANGHVSLRKSRSSVEPD